MPDPTDRLFAGRPSSPDERDYPLSRLTPPREVFPPNFRIPFAGQIRDQGRTGACVGMSLAYAREIQESRQHGQVMPFSPGFIYGLRLRGQSTAVGMETRQGLKNLKDYGAVPEEAFTEFGEVPAIKEAVDRRLADLLPKAKPYRISAYTMLGPDEEIKTALQDPRLGPVTVLLPLYSSIGRISAANPVVPAPAGDYLDHHQMTIVGWREDRTWVMLNSWGPGWGDRGFCYYPMDYELTEAWSMTDDILPHREADPQLHLYWRVQLGAYRVQANAERMAAELKTKGFDAYLVKQDDLYRVQTGAFSVQDNAVRLQGRLSALGYKTMLKHY